MKRWLASLALVSMALLLAACSPTEFMRRMMDRMVPDEDEALAHRFMESLRSGDIEAAAEMLDTKIVQPGVESNLVEVADLLIPSDSASEELVGCNILTVNGNRKSSLTYQYQNGDQWLLVSLTVHTRGGLSTLISINLQPMPKSLGEINAFAFKGKGARHYTMLLVAIAVPLFIIYALVACIRTRPIRRKWLWIIFILLGFGTLTLNWTSGKLFFNPLSILLLGAGIIKQGIYAPWAVSITFPLGAVIFLLRRNKLVLQPENEQVETPPEPSPENAENGVKNDYIDNSSGFR